MRVTQRLHFGVAGLADAAVREDDGFGHGCDPAVFGACAENYACRRVGGDEFGVEACCGDVADTLNEGSARACFEKRPKKVYCSAGCL